MHKRDLIAQVARESGLSQNTVRRIYDMTAQLIIRELSQGGKVVVAGFGTFAMRRRRQRRGFNPRTGAAMNIPAIETPGFLPSDTLRRLIDENRNQVKNDNEV